MDGDLLLERENANQVEDPSMLVGQASVEKHFFSPDTDQKKNRKVNEPQTQTIDHELINEYKTNEYKTNTFS